MYKRFLEHLEQSLFQRFTLQSRPIPAGLEYQVSDRGRNPATIQIWCYQCPEFRKIRYTYIDADASAQILNSVIYPSHHYELPLLGIDFLSFGQVKKTQHEECSPVFTVLSGQKNISMTFCSIWKESWHHLSVRISPAHSRHDGSDQVRGAAQIKFKLCKGYAHHIRVLVGIALPTCISGIFTTVIGLLY